MQCIDTICGLEKAGVSPFIVEIMRVHTSLSWWPFLDTFSSEINESGDKYIVKRVFLQKHPKLKFFKFFH